MTAVRLLALFSIVSLMASCDALKPASSTPKTTGNSGSSGSGSEAMRRREDIADYAKKFVGVPYKYAGQSPSSGFDCSGFTSYVMKGFGITLSPASSEQSTTGRKVSLERVLPGDLVFFGDNSGKIQHVALVVKRTSDGITCVHSTTSRGVIVENVSASTYWKPKILFARDVVSK